MEPGRSVKDRAQEKEWAAEKDAAEWVASEWAREETASARNVGKLFHTGQVRPVIKSVVLPAVRQ